LSKPCLMSCSATLNMTSSCSVPTTAAMRSRTVPGSV
jgi:hypothetical protein